MDLAPKILAATVLGGVAAIYLLRLQIERKWRRVSAQVEAVEIKRMYLNPSWTTSVVYKIDGLEIESKLEIRDKAIDGIIGGPYMGQRLRLRVHPIDSTKCVLDVVSVKIPLWIELIFLVFAAFSLCAVFEVI